MGRPTKGDKQVTFIGIAEGDDSDPAKLTDALRSAAAEAIAAGLVSADKSAWFRITSVEVELANQHPKTFRVEVTPTG